MIARVWRKLRCFSIRLLPFNTIARYPLLLSVSIFSGGVLVRAEGRGGRREGALFEACVDSVESGIEAERGGAKRLELCANLVEGGVSPSMGMVEVMRSKVGIPINVLVRPRGGDFLYTELEVQTMIANIYAYKCAGAAGVVIGALNREGRVDEKICQKLIEAARPMSVTFHRAFDVTADPMDALDSCIRLKVDRILTSGQKPSAGHPEAISLIKQLVKESNGRVVIMAGGGVTAGNIREIFLETGVKEIHGTAGRVTIESKMGYRPDPPLFMGGEKHNTQSSEFITKRISAERVAQFVSEISLE
ncbi:hypothetical protein AAMO2058_000803900 [Amorphochlora amoebiformis]